VIQLAAGIRHARTPGIRCTRCLGYSFPAERDASRHTQTERRGT